MLDQIIRSYLASMSRERQFDLPLATVLGSLDMTDVCLTHSQLEKGKDLIAKSGDGATQWAFQTKKGNLGVNDLNAGGIQGQLLAAVTSGLDHPNFDPTLPLQVVLVTTGSISAVAKSQLAGFNRDTVEGILGQSPIEIWDADILVPLLRKVIDPSLLQPGDIAESAQRTGDFYSLLGKTYKGRIGLQDIQDYLTKASEHAQLGHAALLQSSLELKILAASTANQKLRYEALIWECAALTVCLSSWCSESSLQYRDSVSEYIRLQLGSVFESAREYLELCSSMCDSDEGVISGIVGVASIVTYPVHCARLAEISAFVALFDENAGSAQHALQRLLQLAGREIGLRHPISDRYTISIVLSVLCLAHSHHKALAVDLVKDVADWICDRAEAGAPIATIDEDTQSEVDHLLGAAFSGIETSNHHPSILAAALVDLLAFLERGTEYSVLVNNLKAVGLQPLVFAVPDNDAVAWLSHDQMPAHVGIDYSPVLEPEEDYCQYLKTMPVTYKVADSFGFAALFATALLFRDRHFPSVW